MPPFIEAPLAVLAFSEMKPNLDLEDNLSEEQGRVCPLCGELLYDLSGDDWPQLCPECAASAR